MCQIEILAIGDELLKGMTVNSNAAEIAFALFKNGYQCYQHIALADERALIKNQFQESLRRSQIVIATGGLGPTCDDLTRGVAAEVFDSGFTFNETLAAELKQRYGNLPIHLNDQATVPTKALLLKNSLGTAPGIVFEADLGTLILLPGVPKEMRLMLHEQVIPYLKTKFPSAHPLLSRSLHFFDIGESSIDPALREFERDYPDVKFGIYPSNGLLSVYALITHPNRESEKQLDAIMKHLKQQFAHHFYSDHSEKIEVAVQELFVKKGWTLGTAESCTGGAISARLTKNPGASQYFQGGLITYSNCLKEKLLHVDKEQLLDLGAVSEQTVRSMALGAFEAIDVDFMIAISGIAGPTGGSENKPVGTVWIAIAKKDREVYCRKIQAHGNREMIIERSVNAALGALYSYAGRE